VVPYDGGAKEDAELSRRSADSRRGRRVARNFLRGVDQVAQAFPALGQSASSIEFDRSRAGTPSPAAPL
jgi:hypothetical protein